ncbi:MAG: YceI family protein [Thermoanaerobaculia bacterium]
MKLRLGLAALLAAAALSPAFGATTTWAIDTNHSAAHFGVRHMMVSTVRGEFGKVAGAIAFDDQDPSKTTVEATIDATTINTQVAARDNDLKSDSFFDVAKYPTITFKSTRVTAATPLQYTVDGDLTMHGVTKPVRLHVEVTPAIKDPRGNERRGAEATTKLNRSDFGVTGASGAVGDEVTVIIDLEAVRKAPAPAAK